jgi:hypothetical protein
MKMKGGRQGADHPGAEHHVELVPTQAGDGEREKSQQSFHHIRGWSNSDNACKGEKRVAAIRLHVLRRLRPAAEPGWAKQDG